jgi:hypothetical protein
MSVESARSVELGAYSVQLSPTCYVRNMALESISSCKKSLQTHHSIGINTVCFKSQEPGSSVSIVSGYGLDDRAIEVRSPAEAKGFFL